MKIEYDSALSSVKVSWGKKREESFTILYQKSEFHTIREAWRKFDEEKVFSRKLEYLADIFNMNAEASPKSYLSLLVALIDILYYYNWSSPFIYEPATVADKETKQEPEQ